MEGKDNEKSKIVPMLAYQLAQYITIWAENQNHIKLLNYIEHHAFY